jgi:hypothetical protein
MCGSYSPFGDQKVRQPLLRATFAPSSAFDGFGFLLPTFDRKSPGAPRFQPYY